MYDYGSPVGESCYRLISRTGSFIYLKTRGILEIDEVTREVRSFICINTLVSDDEGRRLIKEMKRKYSAIISEAELNAMENNVVMDVENPQLLERAILNLITNLNNQHSEDEDDAASVVSDVSRSTKAPLAIIAPNSLTVKPSVSKAFDVITQVRGTTNVQIKDEPLSPDTCASSSSSPSSSVMVSTAAAMGACRDNNSKSQYVKVEPSSNILSPTSSTFSISSHDSDVSSPQPNHNNNNNSNGFSRGARTNEFYSNCENLSQQQQQFDNTDTQASLLRTSSCDSFSSNHSNYLAGTAMDSIVNINNNQRSSVLKRTHDKTENCNNNDDDDVGDYNELLKRQMLRSDLSPISQNPPLDLLANATRSG